MAARDLQGAVVRFAALLRRHGLPVTLVEVTDAVRALDHLDLADRNEVFLGFRTIFVSRVEETPAFERCFNAFWRATQAGEPVMQGLIAPPEDRVPERPGTPKVAGQKREGIALDTWMGEDEDSSSEPLGVPRCPIAKR